MSCNLKAVRTHFLKIQYLSQFSTFLPQIWTTTQSCYEKLDVIEILFRVSQILNSELNLN